MLSEVKGLQLFLSARRYLPLFVSFVCLFAGIVWVSCFRSVPPCFRSAVESDRLIRYHSCCRVLVTHSVICCRVWLTHSVIISAVESC